MFGLSFARKSVFTCLCLAIVIRVWAAPAPEVTATVDVTATGAPIHRYVYGMFTGLLGNIFEKGLWAEMLSDRKFFYPVDTTSTLNPVNTRRFQNRWRPVGGVNVGNTPGEDPVIEMPEAQVEKVPEKVQVAPWSISLYELELR